MTVERGGYSPGKNPAHSLGDEFRTTRNAAGVSVEQVEEDLRIKAKYIEAIEDSDAAALPSRAYTDGFLRNYATYLGMDPAEAVSRFAKENGLTKTPPRMASVAPMPKARKKGAGGLAGQSPRRGFGASLGRAAAALMPVFLVAGLGFGGYTGYVAARDAGLLPPELGGAPRSGDIAAAPGPAAAPAEPGVGAGSGDEQNSGEIGLAEKPPVDASGAADAPVETASAEPEQPKTDMIGNETTTGRPDSLSYARKGAVPYWQAKPPAVEPADGPVADIKPETAGLLRAGTDTPASGSSRVSRWTATAARDTPPADVDASRIAAAAREALFGAGPAPSDAATGTAATVGTDTVAGTDTLAAAAPSDLVLQQPATDAVIDAPLETRAVVDPVDTAILAAPTPGPAQPTQPPRRFALVAVSDTWVQVTNGAGSVTYTGILSAGESYNIPAQDGLRLKTGNAGGLYIEVDGQRFGPLGNNGAVMRNVTLNPGAVRASFTLSQAFGISQ